MYHRMRPVWAILFYISIYYNKSDIIDIGTMYGLQKRPLRYHLANYINYINYIIICARIATISLSSPGKFQGRGITGSSHVCP